MSEEPQRVEIVNLPIGSDNRLKVQLIPMPSGDNPWRTQGEYREEQRRDRLRFRVNIVLSVISVLSVVANLIITIINLGGAI